MPVKNVCNLNHYITLLVVLILKKKKKRTPRRTPRWPGSTIDPNTNYNRERDIYCDRDIEIV